ncbi:MAG: hypothetical protein HYT80_03525 [Euryarchaeota archaeon]|nr:hypothetical protein [Euryarchaeota archaeon]
MRFPILVVAALLVGGCLGTGATPAPLAVGPVEPLTLLRVLVVDDEFAPIRNATIIVGGTESRATTDEAGLADLGAAPGVAELRVWAPGYYRSSVDATAVARATTSVTVELDRRPNDLVVAGTPDRVSALCWLAVRSGQPVGSFDCLQVPGVVSRPTTIRYPLRDTTIEGADALLQRLDVALEWGDIVPTTRPILEAHLTKDGTTSLALLGRFGASPPFHLTLTRSQLPAGPVDGSHQVLVRAMPDPAAGPPQYVQGLDFVGTFSPLWLVTAPPNPSWDE